jgi:hypothetical protein
MFHSGNEIDLSRLVDPLYHALWGISLHTILRTVNIDSYTFQYIPEDQVTHLGLINFQFGEPIFLFRPEYETAYNTFNDWCCDGTGGVAVLGQPGIGLGYSTLCVISNAKY